MKTRGSALVFSIILMAAITILGLAAFSLLYQNYQDTITKNEQYFSELEEQVIAQEIYTTIVLEELLETANHTEFVEVDGVEYDLEYDNGAVTYSTGNIDIGIDSDYAIEYWVITSNQED
ncbi:MAG: hypothetical protein ACLFSU_04340 [Acholeplasmataceae bacterium]